KPDSLIAAAARARHMRSPVREQERKKRCGRRSPCKRRRCPIYYPPLSLPPAAVPHSPEEKKKVLARIRRIRGQCEGLERALDAGADCGPVLQQIAAIRGAVNGLMSEVMESHIREQFGTPA